MDVEVPTEVGLDGLIEDVDDIGAAHGHMVLEAVLADVLHQLLQVVDLRHSDAAVHAVGIVGDLSLAEIGLDTALGIVGGDAEEGEGALTHFRIDCTEGVDLTEGTSEYAERTELQVVVAYKLTGEVAAVGADAFIAVFGEVIIPVEQGRGIL